MLRMVLVAALGMVICTSAQSAQAGWWKKCCDDWHYANDWPGPFVCIDASRVRSPFDQMIHNGWRAQNTLSDHHFDPSSHQLTEAGELKLRAILRDGPTEHRTPFVLQASTQQQTAIRVESVQRTAQQIAIDAPPPMVMETTQSPRGTGADYIDEVTRRFRSTTPDPRIPQVEREAQ